VKEIIKYKAYQVAPAELEAVLISHPKVADAAVVPSPDEQSGEVPKAFVVRQPGATVTADELMAFVADHVAPYKKVRRLEFVDSIPKSASGKILRRVLVEAERQRVAR
jgi:acyl-coenzyme A synthetase/AMP-(fatty) acid ligase